MSDGLSANWRDGAAHGGGMRAAHGSGAHGREVMARRMRAGAVALMAVLLMCGLVQAQSFAFAPAPQQDLNRIYRVDVSTGETTACQFAVKDDSPIGLTLCYPAGQGAKAGEAGDYALVASSHKQEAGIFRVNRRTGAVSVCYVREDQEVVCTPPSK